jgi:hypothetical protein
MVVGIIGGAIASTSFNDEDIKDFLFSQAILFKLVLIPPIIYEL